MRDKSNGHRHGRGSRSFEEHRCQRGSASVKKGRPWLFYDAERCEAGYFESHFRVTARTASLDGKHMRSVREPVRAMHVKEL